MNLHGIVRGAINSVNCDRVAVYIANRGVNIGSDYTQSPNFATPVNVRVQIQPLGKEELRHVEKLNMQGVFRTIYLYGDPQAIVRVQVRGGDLFQFAPFQGETLQTWKVIGPVSGPWNVENGGWTKIIVVLQA